MTDAAQAAGEAAPRRGFAIALMVASSVAISFGGLIVRNIDDADTWQINFYRAGALIVAVGILLALQYRGETVARIRGIGRPGLVAGLFMTAAGIAFLQAITHTTVANTLFTLGAIPFITAGLARIFLQERLEPVTVATMIAAALGLAVMMAEGFGFGSAYGNAMAPFTAVCFSSFAVIVRRHRSVDMLPTLLVSGALIALISLAVRFDDLGISLKDMLLCFLWGGVLSGFANGTFIIASRHLVAAELTLFMLLEFALGPLWVWIFLAEEPTRWALIGGTVVIASVAVRALFDLRGPGQPLKRGRPSPP